MRLSDIMGQMHLAGYAEVGLVIFLLAFLAVCVRLFLFTPKRETDEAAQLPLLDDEPGESSSRVHAHSTSLEKVQ